MMMLFFSNQSAWPGVNEVSDTRVIFFYRSMSCSALKANDIQVDAQTFVDLNSKWERKVREFLLNMNKMCTG